MALQYRAATIDDLPLIVEIYNSTIPSRMVTADTEYVSVEDKTEWFREHNSYTRPLWMVTAGSETVGWVSFQSFYGRPAYNGTAEVSIYLTEATRGKGFGKEILRYCVEQANGLQIHSLLGFIFKHNVPSLKLFYGAGFEDWGVLPDVAILDGIKRSLVIVGKRV